MQDYYKRYPRLFALTKWYSQLTQGEVNSYFREYKRGDNDKRLILEAFNKRRVYRKVLG